MKISISDCAKLDELLPIAIKYNVGIEVQEFTSPDFLDDKQFLAKEFSEKIKNIPLRGFHGPFSEMVPASRDKLIAEVTRQRFDTAYRLAAVINVQHLILHTGFIPKTYPHEEWINNSVKFWTNFLSDKNDSIEIHIENVYEDDPSTILELLDKINESLQREAVSSCLDIGHVNANSSKTHKEWITTLGRRIKYVHVHNNGGIFDDHWGLWEGTINVGEVLDLLKEYSPESVWMIEARQPFISDSLEWLKERNYLG